MSRPCSAKPSFTTWMSSCLQKVYIIHVDFLCHKWPRICFTCRKHFRSFPHSWPITGAVTRLTRWVPLVEQELLTLPENMSSPPDFSGIPVTRSLVLFVYFVVPNSWSRNGMVRNVCVTNHHGCFQFVVSTVFSSSIIDHSVGNKNKKTFVTTGAVTAWPLRAPEFTPGF
jgi:hypothetical protein